MSAVGIEIIDGVVVATIDNPPVNALGHAVRVGLMEALDQAANKPLVIAARGKLWSAGADVSEFADGPADPQLGTVIERLAAHNHVTVACIHAAALGGGAEVVLACDHRVMGGHARIGLPEINLGLIPGAGGTQRLPRIIGAQAALSAILSGKPINADAAETLGLAQASDDPQASAMELARGVKPDALPGRAVMDADAFDAVAAKALRRARGAPAPAAAVEAVRASAELGLAKGLKRERDLFLSLRGGPEQRATQHVFFAERRAAKPAAIKGAVPRDVQAIGIIGAGTMGAGIAAAAAGAGFHALLHDRDPDALTAGLARARKALEGGRRAGRTPEQIADALAQLSHAPTLDDMADCDLFIEAVVERMDIKQAVFAALDRIAKPGAVLATNTSYLDIDAIAQATRRPGDVIGMHFFSPAHIMRLLEVVRGGQSSADALATAFAVGRAMNKTAVLAGNADGFIGNRIFKAYRAQAEFLLEDGALPWEVDAALRAFGFAMGPFEASDLAGLDIGYLTRRREDDTRNPDARYVPIADWLYEAGRLGRKTGAGWYAYDDAGRAQPDPAVAALVERASKARGATRTAFSADQITKRLLGTMAETGQALLAEGVAATPDDIDVVLVNGYAFPRHKGGPMWWARHGGDSKSADVT